MTREKEAYPSTVSGKPSRCRWCEYSQFSLSVELAREVMGFCNCMESGHYMHSIHPNHPSCECHK